jgi:hypothetical protein
VTRGLLATIAVLKHALAVVALFWAHIGLAGEGLKENPIATCTCLWEGSFTEIANNADLIMLGAVTEHRGNAADFAIEEILRGPDWHTNVRVWLKARDYCRPDIKNFPLGSRWVLALQHIDNLPQNAFDPTTPNISYGRLDDWILSSCGGYFLQAHGGTVSGNLIPGTPRWDFDPDMNPVLTDLLRSHLLGNVGVETLKNAAQENPEARALMLNTRSFLRGQDTLLIEVPEPSTPP